MCGGEEMKIGIDIDEVVCEFVKEYIPFLNKSFGKNIKYQDVDQWDVSSIFQISKEEERAKNIEFIKEGKHINLKLVEGAETAINHLSQGNQIFFITARPLLIKQDTENYLKKAFPNINFKVFYSDDHWPNKTKKKHEICADLELDLMIDDHPGLLELCSKKGVRCILFTTPWNKDCQTEKGITRKNSWKAIVEDINKR